MKPYLVQGTQTDAEVRKLDPSSIKPRPLEQLMVHDGKEELCQDEGRPQHGTAHVCVSGQTEGGYFTPMFHELLVRRSGDQVNFAALVLGELRVHMQTTSEKNPLLVVDEFFDELEKVARRKR